MSALGPGTGNYNVGNRVINCNIIEGGGQAIGFQYQKEALIADNSFQDSSGCGVSRSDNCIIRGNIAVRSHDAPYFANGNCNNIIISDNISRLTTNGSGIDVVGCSNVVVRGNVIEKSAGWGLLVSYSVQQQVASHDVLVTGNIFKHNCQEISVPMHGEVCVGSPYTKRKLNAADVVIVNNKIIMDGSRGGNTGRFLVAAYGVKNLTIKDNFISGIANKHKEAFVAQSPVNGLIITDNQWIGTGTVIIDLRNSIKSECTVMDNINMTCTGGINVNIVRKLDEKK